MLAAKAQTLLALILPDLFYNMLYYESTTNRSSGVLT